MTSDNALSRIRTRCGLAHFVCAGKIAVWEGFGPDFESDPSETVIFRRTGMEVTVTDATDATGAAAVPFAQLVDGPSAHPEKFVREEARVPVGRRPPGEPFPL